MAEPTEKTWEIRLDFFGGLVPAYYSNSYPYYGNKEDASAISNIDLTDPNVMTQGPGQAILNDGDETGALSTLPRGILRSSVADDVSYMVGGAVFYEITSTAIINGGQWPHTINKGGVTGEDGEDNVHYKGAVYYFYNHSGGAGDIGKYDLAGAFDDDWGSTVATGAGTLQDAPHQAINGGDDMVAFTNGQYIGKIDGTTLTLQALDFWTDAQTASITWNNNRFKIAVNRPNVAGSNFNQSGIFTWNGTFSSWEGDPIEVNGKIGALYTQNGITFVWWQQAGQSNRYNFGYISGLQLRRLKVLSGTLPLWYQVGEYKGFIAWLSDAGVVLYGADDENIPVKLFPFTSANHSTGGGMGTPFGELYITSEDGTGTYEITKPSGYTITSTRKSIAYRVSKPGMTSFVDLVQVETESMALGSVCDFTLSYNKGQDTQSLTQIAFSAQGTESLHKILNKSYQLEDFRLDLDYANGTVNTPVKIRSIYIQGHFVPNN